MTWLLPDKKLYFKRRMAGLSSFFLIGVNLMSNEFGLKELTELTLKATYPIEMDGRKFEAGEVIARFDKIQIANFREITSRVSANGGKSNYALIIWEDPKEI
jgi:hypothetical protein